jgi:hypothetical protein
MREEEIKELVQDYMECYDDIHNMDNIHEYVDGMLPTYLGETYSEYHEHIGTPLNIEITQDMVGKEFWQIMNLELYAEYYYMFMTEFNKVVEEMEEE